VSGPARVLVKDLPQRHRHPRGDLGFIDGPIGAKQSQFPYRGRNGQGPARSPRPPPLGQSVRNKANSSGATRRARTLWEKSYDAFDTPTASAKQSQFPHRQRWARLGKAARAAGETHRAEQSQLAPHRPEKDAGRQGRRCGRRWGRACETKPISGIRPTRWIGNRQLRAQRGNPPPHAGHTRL
jgi:hypothetical protein